MDTNKIINKLFDNSIAEINAADYGIILSDSIIKRNIYLNMVYHAIRDIYDNLDSVQKRNINKLYNKLVCN